VARKIDKLELGPNVVHWNRRYPGQYTKIAEKIKEETGFALTRNQVTDWIKANITDIKQENVIKEEAKQMLADDRNKMLEFYQAMLGDALKNYQEIRDSNKTPEQKLEAIGAVMEYVLNRGLDGVGYGKAGPSINIQNNTIVVQTLDRVVEVIHRRYNGESREIIEELESIIGMRNQ
jgi:hypothetical protein